MFKKYYLAYGSNLNLEQMVHRCPLAMPIGIINLKGYKLVYKGSADDFSYLTIEKSDNSYVPLGVYKVTYLDMYFLDKYEGYPTFYSKYYLPINVDGKTKKALIYIMNPYFDYHIPSDEYIITCMRGYEDFGFDQAILEKALIDTKGAIKKLIK